MQHKELADAASEGSLFLPHIVKVDDQAEHEHRSQDRPDRLRPRPRNPLDPRGGGKQPRADQEAYPEPERTRQMAEAPHQEAETQQTITVGKATNKQTHPNPQTPRTPRQE